MATNSQPIIRHVVSSTDTLDALAFRYRGNIDDWQIIADFNQLDEPYITTDSSEFDTKYASGLILFTRQSGTTAPLTIPKGTQVQVPVIDGVPVAKVYTVQADATIPANKSSILAFAMCTQPGEWGNAIPGEIRAMVVTSSTPSAVAALLVTNPAPFSNGGAPNVKQPGDVILIPVDNSLISAGVTMAVQSEDDYLQVIGGTDLALTPDGDFMVDAYGDLATFSGMDNMADAAGTRLSTEHGELILHPDYGSAVKALTGEPNASIRTLLAGVEIQRSLLQDDRFIDVQPNNLQIQGNRVYVEPTITINTGQTQSLGSMTL